MEYRVRRAQWSDLERACEVEAAAVRGLYYLRAVADVFFNDQVGELGGVEADGVIAGIGKYTHLYDGGVWLETLRVDPIYQGRGIGKAFYRRFFELADLQGVNRMGMYTGLNNLVSKGLALKFGFEVSATYRGANLLLAQHSEELPFVDHGFKLLDEEQALLLLNKKSPCWGQHFVMNRTFYPLNEELFKGLAREEKVYYDEQGDNLLVLGARFMPETALHIAFYAGDYRKIFNFAYQEAVQRQVEKITIVFTADHQKVREEVLAAGYTLEPSDLIVCEWFRK